MAPETSFRLLQYVRDVALLSMLNEKLFKTTIVILKIVKQLISSFVDGSRTNFIIILPNQQFPDHSRQPLST